MTYQAQPHLIRTIALDGATEDTDRRWIDFTVTRFEADGLQNFPVCIGRLFTARTNFRLGCRDGELPFVRFGPADFYLNPTVLSQSASGRVTRHGFTRAAAFIAHKIGRQLQGFLGEFCNFFRAHCRQTNVVVEAFLQSATQWSWVCMPNKSQAQIRVAFILCEQFS